MFGWNPSMGLDSFMSRDTPCGRPSTMSMRTTSARPFWTTRIAVVAPTNPLPTIVTRMRAPSFEWDDGILVGLREVAPWGKCEPEEEDDEGDGERERDVGDVCGDKPTE